MEFCRHVAVVGGSISLNVEGLDIAFVDAYLFCGVQFDYNQFIIIFLISFFFFFFILKIFFPLKVLITVDLFISFRQVIMNLEIKIS